MKNPAWVRPARGGAGAVTIGLAACLFFSHNALAGEGLPGPGSEPAPAQREAGPQIGNILRYPFRLFGRALEKGLLLVEEKHLDRRLQLAVAYFNERGLFPLSGSDADGSGIGFGILYKPYRGPERELAVTARASAKLYQEYALQYRARFRQEGRWFFEGLGRYQHLPREDFFGTGIETAQLDRTSYRLDETLVEAKVGSEITPWVRISARAAYRRNATGAGTDRRFPSSEEVFRSEELPAFGEELSFASFGGQISLDTRDVPGDPRRGGMAALELEYARGLGETAYDYRRLALELQGAVPLSRYDHALVTRVRLAWTDPLKGQSAVPFFVLPHLGGSESLRGFREFRFRDEDLVLANLEYRWSIWRSHLDAALFLDSGGVYQDLTSQFTARSLRHAYGLGFRFRNKNGIIFRIDIARSSEGTRSFFKFTPPF